MKPSWLAPITLACVALSASADTPPADAPPPPPAPAPAPAAPPAEDLAQQLAVYGVLAPTAPQIDQCTARYSTEFPDRKGELTISVQVMDGGRVQDVSVKTELKASDRLTDCVATIARVWRFSRGPFSLSLPVPVAPGAKLKLKKPGEKDPPAPAASGAPAAAKDEGFIRFTPSWTQSD